MQGTFCRSLVVESLGNNRRDGFSQFSSHCWPCGNDPSEFRVTDAEQDAETRPILLADGLQDRRISRRISLFGPVAERQTQRT